HTSSNRVALMSLGDLEGKTVLTDAPGTIVEGEDCGYSYTLSNAVRDALKEKPYDTVIDADVTNSTGLFVGSNCIKVRGKAIDSKKLTQN
ncbi:MAG: hypothetical protein LAC70_02825, partial [Methylovulum sp.]|nr:hypothetical protein [Methylovulum sp.]